VSGQVLFIHGAGGGAWEFDSWQEEFERYGWRTLARNLSANGDLSGVSFLDYLSQVEEWVKSLQEPPVIIGASLGGLLALKAAESIPLRALVLVNPIPPAGFVASPRLAWPDVVAWSQSPLADTEKSMFDCTPESAARAHSQWRDESGRVLAEAHAGIDCRVPSAPTLVLISQLDADVPPGDIAAMAASYGSDVHFCKGMSHLGPLLGPHATEVCRVVIDWLGPV